MSASTAAAPQKNILGGFLGMLGMSGIAGVLIAALITPVVAVVGVASNSTIALFESLPDYLEIGALQQKTELYAMQGGQEVKFAEFYAQNRVEVELDEISQYAIDAAISTEDPRFYEHGGVDVISATRALFASVISDSGAGASTITMQYVRNVRVQTAESIQDPTERQRAYDEATQVSTGRKLQEMRLAIGVEQQYTKPEILKGYLNIALFGGTTYGIESAAQYYFGKSAKDLTLAESASLIATVQNPNVYRVDNPDNLENNRERRDYVLMRMLDEGRITQQEHDDAVAQPVEPHITPTQHGCTNAQGNAQYFCDYVRNVILNDPAFGDTYEARLFNFQTKGYQIHTTLNLDLQQNAQSVLSSSVPAAVEGADIGAASSAIEAGTGRILMMVQNTTFDETDAAATTPGLSAVNYNTDYAYGGSTGFQVGSTYKIFTLSEWVASGHSINDTVNAATRTFEMSNFRTSCGDANGGPYNPQNDANTRVGNVSVLQATMNSYNTAFVAMAERLDQCRIRDTAMAMGAHRADGTTNTQYVSDVLGTNEIAPMSMAVAIATVAAGGVSCSPIAIDRIEMRDGTAIPAPKSTCVQALTPEVAASVAQALQATANGGTAAPGNPGIVPMIGKTGTNDDALQTWLVSATTRVGLAVWVGNSIGQTSLYDFQLANGRASQERHVITQGIMSDIMTTYGGGEFPQPPSGYKPELATVPDITGRTIEEATAALEQLGYHVAVGDQIASSQPAGTIGGQLPTANTQVDKGTTVTIRPSTGEGGSAASLTMPDLTGLAPNEAVAMLAQSGFAGTVYQYSEPAGDSGVQPGQIARTEPAAEQPLVGDGEVSFYVAQ